MKAAAEIAPDGGYRFLRRLREATMCERRKLDGAEALTDQAQQAGLDPERFRVGLRSHAITEALGADLEATAALADEIGGVEHASAGSGGTPLPTAVFAGEDGSRAVVSGVRPYGDLRAAAVTCGAVAQTVRLDVEGAVARFGRVTTREVEVLCDLSGPRGAAELWRLAEAWKLRPVPVLTGHLWEAA
jgi:hypothetical protein